MNNRLIGLFWRSYHSIVLSLVLGRSIAFPFPVLSYQPTALRETIDRLLEVWNAIDS
jgi:hypothetical protein